MTARNVMIPKPNLFVVGAPRCGTTALHSLLAQHPDIFMTRDKEPHYFSKDLIQRYEQFQNIRIRTHYHDLDEYLHLFDNSAAATIRGESSVFYLYSDAAPNAIHSFDSEARITIILRDPVHLMQSIHTKLRLMGDEDRADFTEALNLEDRRRAGQELPNNVRVPYLLFYSDYARLALRIRSWLDRFGSGQVLILLLDDWRSDTERTFHRVLEFLAVERLPLPRGLDRNPSREPRWTWLNRLLTTRAPDGRYRFDGRMARRVRRYNARPARRNMLDPSVSATLRNRFRPEVEALSELLDRDLAAQWGYK